MTLGTKIKIYMKSFSTKLALFIGVLMYCTYSFKGDMWKNKYLIGVTAFVGVFLPHFTKFIDYTDRKTAFLTSSVFAGKIGRFIPQIIFNFATLEIMYYGDVLKAQDLEKIGGVLGAAFLTTCASQGLQYIALILSNRDIGNKNVNVTISLSLNSVVTALAAVGFTTFQKLFIAGGIILGIIGILYSLLTDLMAFTAPKGGVGVFCGTFNPVHKTHIELVKRIIEDRKLEKLYIHPTVIPKGHQQFLDEGIIRIAKMEGGMRFYEKTEKADVHVNYFPTGNKFYEVENRVAMLKAAIHDYHLEDKVEVLCYPEIYAKDGFFGIIKLIKEKNKGKRIHGLHGSDVGGMMVRAIYDQCMGIWAYPVRRTNNVSATAIRNGAKGMTSPTTTKILEFLNNAKNNDEIDIIDKKYKYVDHRLIEEKKNVVNV